MRLLSGIIFDDTFGPTGFSCSASLTLLTARHFLPCWKNDRGQIVQCTWSSSLWKPTTLNFKAFEQPAHFLMLPAIFLRTKLQRVVDPLVVLLFLWQELLDSQPQFGNLPLYSVYLLSDEWWASTSDAGKGLFRDGTFPLTFFGAEAADILLRLRPWWASTTLGTQCRWMAIARKRWQRLFRAKRRAITRSFSIVKALHPVRIWSLTVHKVHAGLETLAKLVIVHHSLRFI